jgi:hypothetical protein
VEAPARSPSRLADEVLDEARRLTAEPGFPAADLNRIRAAAARLGVTDVVRDDVRGAALLVEQLAVIDVEVPVTGRALHQRLVKQTVRKLIGWYVRSVGHQVGVLGRLTARFGLAVAERLDRLEATRRADHEALAARLAALEARVDQLEARS